MQHIKNIIFDYGNVIFEIDFKITQNAFAQLGITDIENFFAHKGHNQLFDDFETGAISPAQFREGIRTAADKPELTDEQIDNAWNSLLIGTMQENHDLLLKVKDKYRTFLLSNNNEIHYNWIIDYLKTTFKINNYDDYFEKAYFSQHMKLRKPNTNIFEQVLKDNQLDPAETLFIDDSPQHIEGAKKVGLNTLLMTEKPAQLESFLKSNGII
ncbi:HAD family hydrolase [Pedobacter rhizosphaerae]|uniref:Putative hydrolase of the HAD superfamily n=1 Tax=Pedobacter rhizosphaerae TaxID=390241 RepID=A0A1H9P300_9SPHI|nr:HAD family phosphatase [Pedobacter rhizosphaerae]SER42664.1 putative hydrolase of the HAD superfamily [Pedobacter rhizosphaerae]